MANRKVSMRKVKEVLRLHFEAGLSNRRIARSTSVSRTTVAQYLRRAREAGLSWPLPEEWGEAELRSRLYGDSPEPARRPQPDFAAMHRELRRRHVTLQLLWQEYKQVHPDGYQYSQYCELYRRWKKTIDVVLRQDHRAGEKMFVDYAGDKVDIVDPKTGEVRRASIFVAVLGASNYSFAEATLSEELPCWLGSHVRALEFFGGVPRVAVPDNPKTAVSRACRYEPDLNPSYSDLADHYRMAVLPARPRKPRDKAKVESGVLVVERWILAALRNRRFFSPGELNQAVGELIEQLNRRPFQKLPGCRADLFDETDRPALQPLPRQPYRFSRWKKARVNIDYHVELEKHYYSVPYALVRREVDIRHTASTVEIFHDGQRVASHRKSPALGRHTTVAEHRPRSHRRYLEWTPSRILSWAAKTGPSTAIVAQRILESRTYPEQGYRACLGLLRLGKTYSPERLEAACARAAALNACSYKSVKSILRTGLDNQPLPEKPPSKPAPDHSNIRGADYFQTKETPC